MIQTFQKLQKTLIFKLIIGKHWILPKHQSHSKYYRPSYIASPISPQTLETNWSVWCILKASAAASSELNPPHDEPLDPLAAHQEVIRKVPDPCRSAPTSVKFLRSQITDGESSPRNYLVTYTHRQSLTLVLLTWEE